MKKFLPFVLVFIFGCSDDPDVTFMNLDDPLSLNEEEDPLKQVMNRDEEIPTYGSMAEALSAGAAVFEPGAELCQGRIGPGQYCFIPQNLNIVQQNNLVEDNDPVWHVGINVERDSVKDRLNGFGWNFSIATPTNPANWNLNIVPVHPTIPSRVGEAAFWIAAYVVSDQGGTYGFHYKCRVNLYKNTILAMDTYVNGSATNRLNIVQNVTDHELTHCSGPPHTVTGLMTPSAGNWSGVNLNPYAWHQTWLNNYNP